MFIDNADKIERWPFLGLKPRPNLAMTGIPRRMRGQSFLENNFRFFTVSSDRKSNIIFRILTQNYRYPEIFRSLGQFLKNHPQPVLTLIMQAKVVSLLDQIKRKVGCRTVESFIPIPEPDPKKSDADGPIGIRVTRSKYRPLVLKGCSNLYDSKIKRQTFVAAKTLSFAQKWIKSCITDKKARSDVF